MEKQRPKNLNLATVRLPIPDMTVLLHRVSGVGIFLFLPFVLYLVDGSLSDGDAFITFQNVLHHPLTRFILFGLSWAYAHHFLAEIRLLLLDLDIGTELSVARISAKLVVSIACIIALVVGVTLLW